jgi:hypothetical protein
MLQLGSCLAEPCCPTNHTLLQLAVIDINISWQTLVITITTLLSLASLHCEQ